MRYRVIVAVGLLALPSIAAAQFRMPGQPRVQRELPPSVRPVRDAQKLYQRLPLSFEAYPMFASFSTSGFSADGGSPSWLAAGSGVRADYRVARLLSVTGDLTSTVVGGPSSTQSLELGVRVGPRRSEHSVYPFLDLRYGYFQTGQDFSRGYDEFGIAPVASSSNIGVFSGRGLGPVAGAGVEFALTQRFSLTTAASAARVQMNGWGYQTRQTRENFLMNSVRYVIALRYNGVRAVPAATSTTSQH